MSDGIPDVYVVFADEESLNSSKCEQGRHLYCICESKKHAERLVKSLNGKNSIYKNAYYESWSVQ